MAFVGAGLSGLSDEYSALWGDVMSHGSGLRGVARFGAESADGHPAVLRASSAPIDLCV